MLTGVAFLNLSTQEVVPLDKPNRHNHVIEVLYKLGDRPNSWNWAQGFVDAEGKFYTRRAAAVKAFECGQIKEKIDILFSEDLW